MASSPRTPAPERPPPPVPQPKSLPPPSPSRPRNETQTPHAQESQQEETTTATTTTTTTSPPLSPLRFTAPLRSLPSQSAAANGPASDQDETTTPPRRPPLRLATSLVRTPSQGSLAKTPSPSPSPSPSPHVNNNNNNNNQSTLNHAEPTTSPLRSPLPAPKPALPAVLVVARQFDPAEEAITSPLRTDKPKRSPAIANRLEQQQAVSAAGNTGVPPPVPNVVMRDEARMASAALRVATAALCLAAFSVMASDKTSGWTGDHYGRYEEYRYAVGVNVIACAYSISQAYSEIRRMVTREFLLRTASSYYFGFAMDQILAYLLMSASSAAASRNDLWVSRFGRDAFTNKINSSVWMSFLAFLALAASSVISIADVFSMIS